MSGGLAPSADGRGSGRSERRAVGAPVAELRDVGRPTTASARAERALHGAAVLEHDRADGKRRRHACDKPDGSPRELPDLEPDAGTVGRAAADEPRLRLLGVRQHVGSVARRGVVVSTRRPPSARLFVLETLVRVGDQRSMPDLVQTTRILRPPLRTHRRAVRMGSSRATTSKSRSPRPTPVPKSRAAYTYVRELPTPSAWRCPTRTRGRNPWLQNVETNRIDSAESPLSAQNSSSARRACRRRERTACMRRASVPQSTRSVRRGVHGVLETWNSTSTMAEAVVGQAVAMLAEGPTRLCIGLGPRRATLVQRPSDRVAATIVRTTATTCSPACRARRAGAGGAH